MNRVIRLLFLLSICFAVTALSAVVQAQDDPVLPPETPVEEEQPEAPRQVSVEPTAQDEQIEERLNSILAATDWFMASRVAVQDGVVFLDGQTLSADRRQWAGDLARNTQDVVAVVNRIEVMPRAIWDFSPAQMELWSLWRGAVQSIPLIVFGALVLLFTWWVARLIKRLTTPVLQKRIASPLLASLVERLIIFPVFLLGLYLILQVAGLTRLAITLLGGTGIVGIVVGFAFRDIAENFLASVLLSMRRPFQSEDIIEVAGHTGIVQQMNTRSTILMSFEGNHVQIPNATVFKSTIVNYTANPNRRSDFVVGIGYGDSILEAQAVVARVLAEHPAVLASPEPMVLVERLGAATIDLHVYFWYNGKEYSPLKVKSSVIRLTKRALMDAGISMPDEAREVIFPNGVPLVHLPPAQQAQVVSKELERPDGQPPADYPRTEPVVTAAEGDLRSEEFEIRQQAEHSRAPEEGGNLLEDR